MAATIPPETIDELTKEIDTLRQANVVLQEQMAKLLAPATSPDDFAAALQGTVDRLQTKLGSLSNPISNFAVKDFRLETNLAVSVTPLGTLQYRLLQPGIDVDPNLISKLTLTLVPIDKRPEGTLSPVVFEPNKELTAIGMDDALRKTLEENHIFTISDFRAAAIRAKVRGILIASGVTPEDLSRFQARAELALLTGVDAAIADRLIAANIDGLAGIARATPEGLMLIVVRLDRAEAEQWIAAAQSFTGIKDSTMRIIRIDSDPPRLFVSLGGERYTDEPIVRQLPVKELLSVSTFGAQLIGSTGYEFVAWSDGATRRSRVLQQDAVTAGFRVACYSVVAASVSPGGVLLIEPPIGLIPGFPANCYAAGSEIVLVAKPEEGFRLRELTISAGGTTRSVDTLRTPLFVNGPIVAHASFDRSDGRLSIREVA